MDELEMFQHVRPEGSVLDTRERAEIRAALFGIPIQDPAEHASRTGVPAGSWLIVDPRTPARRRRSPWTMAATIAVVIAGGVGVWIASMDEPVNEDAAATSASLADEPPAPATAPTTDIEASATTSNAPAAPRCGTMPPFGAELTAAQIDDLIAYLRTLDVAVAETQPLTDDAVVAATPCGPTTYCIAKAGCFELTEQQVADVIAYVRSGSS